MRGITKRFPGVLALDHVDLTAYPGQVLALVGENGAGKSTLMKVLSGVRQMDEGEILMEGKPVKIDNPLASQLMGISIIYQELSVLDNMNIAENIFLGREKRKGSMFVDKKSMHGEARKLLDEVGLDMDTRTMAGELSTAQKQMIEVAKALSFNSKIIIMDEPTSSLTETETEILFGIIRKLRDKGVAIVFISHKLAEIFAITDEVAILRDGVSAGRMVTEGCSENDIIKAMVGRDVNDLYAKQAAPIGDVVLEVKNLSTKGFLKDINFQLRAGEILGFAGLVGAGRSEVMRAVFGIDPKQTGGIDLSVGSIYGLSGVISAMCCFNLGMPVFPAILVGILAGAVFGFLNSLLVIYCKLPPFIGTLGTQQIVRGVCTILTKGYPISKLPEAYMFLGQGEFLGIPMAVWCMVVVAIICHIFLEETVTGRRILRAGCSGRRYRPELLQHGL